MNFQDVLDQTSVADKSPQERADKLGAIEDILAKSGKLTAPQMRAFRDARLETYDEDTKRANPTQSPFPVSPPEQMPIDASAGGGLALLARDWYRSKLAAHNLWEDAKDVFRVGSVPLAATGLGKNLYDLVSLGAGAITALGNVASNAFSGVSALPSFTETVDWFQQNAAGRYLKRAFDEAGRDDPEKAQQFAALTTDAVLGGLFGIGRAMQAAKAAGGLGAFEKARQFAAPVVSNTVGGQLVYGSLEGVDTLLEKEGKDLSPEVQNGIRLAAGLGLGFMSALGPEKVIERALAGDSKILRRLKGVSDSGGDAEKLRANPDYVQSFEDNPSGKLSPAALEKASADITAIQRAKIGEPLSLEEAVVAQESGPRTLLDPFSPEEIDAKIAAREEAPFEPVDSFLAQAPDMGVPAASQLSPARRAIEAIDALTDRGYKLENALKTATDDGRKAEISTEIERNRQRGRELQKTIAEEVLGLNGLGRIVSDQLTGIDSQLARVEEQLATATKPQTIARRKREKSKLLARRKRLLEDRELFLARTKRDATTLEAKVSKAAPGIPEELAPQPEAQEKTVRQILARPDEPSKVEGLQDPQTILSRATPEEQFRIKGLHEAAESGLSQLLRRPITEEERLDLLQKVIADKRSWSNNPWISTSQAFSKDGQVNAGWVGERFPNIGRVLQIVSPNVVRTATYSADEVLGISQSITARAGLGMDDAGWMAQRDILKEAYDLWDYVKTNAPQAPKAVQDALKTLGPQSSPQTLEEAFSFALAPEAAKQAAKAFQKVFPDLALNKVTQRALPKGVKAFADSLLKTVTVGAEKVDLQEIAHEFGHLSFWHSLNAEQRMAWMDSMRKNALSEENWAEAFPSYRQKAEGLPYVQNPEVRADIEYWLGDPSEMYAQQFSAFVLGNVLPSNVQTLKGFSKAFQQVKTLLGMAATDWDAMPEATRHAFLKAQTMPDPSSARQVPKQQSMEAAQGSWLYSDKDGSKVRVQELREEIDSNYNQRVVQLPVGGPEALAAQDAVAKGQIPSIFSLPLEERAGLYTLDDLPKVAEIQALSILHDLPGADYKELQLVLGQLSKRLSGTERKALIDERVKAGLSPRSPYDPDAQTLRSLEDFHKMDDASGGLISEDIARRKGQALELNLEVAKDAFRSIYPERKPTQRELNIIADAIEGLDDPVDIQNVVRAVMQDPTSAARNQRYETQFEERFHQANRQLAAYDRYLNDLTDFSRNVLAAKGLVEEVNPTFVAQMRRAEMFADWQTGRRGFTSQDAWKLGTEAFIFMTSGATIDEEGNFSIDWEKALRNPLLYAYPAIAWRSVGKKAAGLWNKTILPTAIKKAEQKGVGGSARTFKEVQDALIFAVKGVGQEAQTALRTGLGRAMRYKQDILDLSERLYRTFSKEERDSILRRLYKTEGHEKIDLSPEAQQAVQAVERLLQDIPKRFEALGVKLDKRVYLPLVAKNVDQQKFWFVSSKSISGLKGQYLDYVGDTYTVRNPREAKPGGPAKNELSLLEQDFEEGGFILDIGAKINIYKNPEGEYQYARHGSERDYELYNSNLEIVSSSFDGPGAVVEKVTRNKNGRVTNVQLKVSSYETEAIQGVMDISVKLARLAEQVEIDLRKAEAFFVLSKDPRYAVRPSHSEIEDIGLHPDWVVLDAEKKSRYGMPVYGALGGMRVSPQIKEILDFVEPYQSKSFGLARGTLAQLAADKYQGLLSFWKTMKTIMVPTAHFNNVVGNMFMGYMTGRNPLSDVRKGWDIIKLHRDFMAQRKDRLHGNTSRADAKLEELKKSPYWDTYQEIREIGLIDSSMWASDISSENLTRALERQYKPSDWDKTVGRLLGWREGELTSYLGRVKGVIGGVYEAEDLVYKFGAFYNERLAGKTPADAVSKAYESYFDYGSLTPLAQTLKRTGIVPFISWLSNAVPAMLRGAQEHPERVLATAIALEAANAAGVAYTYGSEDLAKKVKRVDQSAPDWIQERGMLGFFRTNIFTPLSEANKEAGNQTVARHTYLNTSRFVPGGDWLTSSLDMVRSRQETGVGTFIIDLWNRFLKTILENPLGSMVTAAAGKDSFGRPIFVENRLNSGVLENRKAEAYALRLAQEWLPNLPGIPGTWQTRDYARALGAGDYSGLDEVGLPRSLGTTVAGTFGVKLRTIYPEIAFEREVRSQVRDLKEEQSRVRAIFRNHQRGEEYKNQRVEDFVNLQRDVSGQLSERALRIGRLLNLRKAQTEQGAQSLPR